MFLPKKKMKLYPTEKLKPQDIVLVEGFIGRYRLNDKLSKKSSEASSNDKRYPGRQPWERWLAFCELISISLLWASPDVFDDDDAIEAM